jgi:hypothetical protein
MRIITIATKKGIPLMAMLFVAGCSANEGSWPRLAGDPPASEVTLLPTIAMPPPSPVGQSQSPLEAKAVLAELPTRLEALLGDAAQNRRYYEEAKQAIRIEENTQLQGMSYRTAQVALSRLSQVESRLSALWRTTDTARVTLYAGQNNGDDVPGRDIESSLQRLEQAVAGLNAYLQEERQALIQTSAQTSDSR